MVSATSTIGCSLYRDATSLTGASLRDVAYFAAIELRIRNLERYIHTSFPGAIFRERQDLKVSYEVSSAQIRISQIFSSIEENKPRLQFSDYGVSQASLEQVFN